MEQLYAVRLHNLLQTSVDLGARMAELRRFREVVREAETAHGSQEIVHPVAVAQAPGIELRA
jgi:hypothetical protein